MRSQDLTSAAADIPDTDPARLAGPAMRSNRRLTAGQILSRNRTSNTHHPGHRRGHPHCAHRSAGVCAWPVSKFDHGVLPYNCFTGKGLSPDRLE